MSNYHELEKQELISRIEELEIINNQLLHDKEQEVSLNFPWTGNLGHWYWNVKTNSVIFNPLKVTSLGYSKQEIPGKVTYQFFTEKLHPNDYQNTMNAMLLHIQGKANVYETEYRIQTKNGGWKWFYDRGKITKYDNDGSPLLVSGIVFDVTEKKEFQLELEYKNKLLEELSSTDGLTKLKNHRALMENLNAEIEKAKHSNLHLSIAMFDIDNFKNINDTKGHIFGDEVLAGIADIMVKNVRHGDVVGRYGGEEFLIIFPNTNAETARSISERIRIFIENNVFGQSIRVTVSGGVKEFESENLSSFVHAADEKLYLAKNSGKNIII